MTISDGCDGVLYSGVIIEIIVAIVRNRHRRCWKGWIDILKNIQISEELFFTLLKYHLVEIEDVLPEIKKGLEDKLEAMVRRDLYVNFLQTGNT